MSSAPVLRVGNQSAFSAAPWTAPFDFAVQHGFDAFEWFPDKKPDGAGFAIADLSASQRQHLRARARDAGISLSVHAPLHASPLRNGRELDDSLRLAVDLGAGLLNIHLELGALTQPRSPGVEEFARALESLIQRCSISGVRLAIENVPGTSPEDFNRLFALLPRAAREPVVGMCLDIGHANMHATTHNDYLGFVDRLSAEVPIIHLHLHENHGDRDSHLVLFTGPAGRDPAGVIGLLERLAKRGYEGNAILEQWPHPPEQLIGARDRLMELVRQRSA
jgi:sugar phosphate isomerase/epimerase